MKKIVFILGICCLLATHTFAQNSFRFGVQASPTWSWLKSEDKLLESAGTNWGMKLGLMGEKYFQPNYAFISGIGFAFNTGGFVQSGYHKYRPFLDSDLSIKLSETDSLALPVNSKLHYRLRYVEIPFGLKLKGGTNEDSPLKYYAEAPVITLGFATKALGDILGAGSSFDTEDENVRDDVKGLALSWGFGGGIEYEIATHTTVFAGFFFQNNFTDTTAKARYRKTAADNWADEKAKTSFRSLTLRAGVYF